MIPVAIQEFALNKVREEVEKMFPGAANEVVQEAMLPMAAQDSALSLQHNRKSLG